MTYKTPESLIRQIMAGNLQESAASDHMAPALKTDDSARLTAAASVLKASGVGSAAVKDNAITVSASEMNQAANILDAALQHGMITVKPQLVSAEALPMPEPHVPAPEFAKEAVEDETEINQGSVDADGKVKLEPRSLNNRMQNQIKKVDEEVEQIDELSKKTLGKYIKRAAGSIDDHAREATSRDFRANAALKAGQGAKMDAHDKAKDESDRKSANRQLGISRAVKRLTKEDVTQIDELSYSTLKSYQSKAEAQGKSDKLTRKIARRKNYIATAKMKKQEKVSKAAFGEESNPLVMIERVRMLAEGKGRLTATFHSECGKHTAKCYHDREWGEHRVEFHINGKHHEPADSHHSDKEDAHSTAKHELHRMSKLNGALKEAVELGEDLSWLEEEFEQLDELSKHALKAYGRAAMKDNEKRGHEVDKTRAGNDIHNHIAVAAKHDQRRHFILKAARKITNGKSDNDKRINHHKGEGTGAQYHGKLNAAHRYAKRVRGIGEEAQQIDEISKSTLASYRGKAGFSASKALHHAQHAQNHGSEEGKKAAEGHFKTVEKRRKGIAMARQSMLNKALRKEEAEEGNTPFLGEAIEQLQELETIGAYTNRHGETLKVHRHPGDPKHLLVSHKGKVVDYHHGKPGELHKKLTKDGLTGSIKEDVEQIDELSHKTLKSYVSKAHKDYKTRQADNYSKLTTRWDDNPHKDHIEANMKVQRRRDEGKKLARAKLRGPKSQDAQVFAKEEFHLTEAKADVEKSTKHLMKHPEADAIGKSIMHATKSFNYVQDAVDHVYNNHSKDVSYEDHHKMRPHLEDHFKKAGLK